MANATATSNVETVEEMYAAFNEGDLETVVGRMDPDIEWIEPEGSPYSGTHRGPEAVVENVFKRVMEEIEDFEVATERFIDGEDTIVVVGTARGTAMASGKPLNVPLAHVCDLADGRMTRFVDYTDTLAWQQALST